MQKACRASFQASGFFGPAIFRAFFWAFGLGPRPESTPNFSAGKRNKRNQGAVGRDPYLGLDRPLEF